MLLECWLSTWSSGLTPSWLLPASCHWAFCCTLTCSACPLCCRHLLHPEEEDWSEDEDGSIALPALFPCSVPALLSSWALG